MASAGHVPFNSNASLTCFLNLVLNMLFVQQEHIEVTSVDHVTFNSNAVLPVSESGVKYAICSAGTYRGGFCWSCAL